MKPTAINIYVGTSNPVFGKTDVDWASTVNTTVQGADNCAPVLSVTPDRDIVNSSYDPDTVDGSCQEALFPELEGVRVPDKGETLHKAFE